MADTKSAIAPAVLGCAGLTLSADEKSFFRDANPLGFILFARNCDAPDQVHGLVDALRDSVGRTDAPVLIDQEGGRVARLTPPHWRQAPAPAVFAAMAEQSRDRALEAAKLNAHMMATELLALGITVDCTPVLDLPQPGADPIIGNRALGVDTKIISLLGRAVCDGMMAGGVLPVIKHIPGHGRATADSHKALPIVETDLDELRKTDFVPFQALRDMPWAMTAHVQYTCLDSELPATTSKTIINDIIRGEIGYQGVLLSDDLSMKALSGDMRERTTASLDAGCDIALHCNGERPEMEAIINACGKMRPETTQRLQYAESFRKAAAPLDLKDAEAKLKQLMKA
ncbi:MAG: beta-N-acetylhexosaminidase [Rhodospirillales bacterium]|jgi:beta-N-acetylhexosaminidase